MTRALAPVLCCAAAWAGSAAAGPLPRPPPGLVERTRGAWLDIYSAWGERPDGNGMPVDPGPAFCVGTDGVALIDQNAVAGSLHQFATVLGRGPFAARARAFDRRSGLAAIQIHPKALEGVRCLEPAGEDAPPVVKGDVLFALGPPGAEATALRVGKVSRDALSFEGSLQSTFLAGSPLVDANARLRGVLVAGSAGGRIGQAHATGPLAGLANRRHGSRAIPLAAALTLVERLKTLRGEGVPVPPADPLVRVAEEVFPRALRRAPRVTAEDLALYSATNGEVGVEFLTPVSLDAQLAPARYVYSAGRTFFRGPAHAQMWEPMVVVQQSPHLDTAPVSTPAAVLALERGGERVEPADAFLDCFDEYIAIEPEPGKNVFRKVKGCRTFYLFPPGAFAPGADVIVRVKPDQQGESAAVPVRPETQARIAADFAPWRAAMLEKAPSPDAVIFPRPSPGVPFATKTAGIPELHIVKSAGCSFVVALLQRDGKLVIRIPVVYVKNGLTPVAAAGSVYIGREEISFEPVGNAKDQKHAFVLPRAEATVSTTDSRRLRIEGRGRSWQFRPALDLPQPWPPGETFLSAVREAAASAVELAAKLAGDFNQALRAFDAPELLETMPPLREAERPATAGETPW